MSLTLACPNCGAPLAYPGTSGVAVRCSYCSSTVILPASLQPNWLAGTAAPAASSLDIIELSGTIREVNKLVSDGKRIEAIKLYKDRFGVGLKEAKEAVERIERGEPVQLTQIVNSHAQQPNLSLPKIEAELRQLLQSGRKIEAIQRYREIFEEGLSGSRDAVDAFENGEALRIPIGWGQAESALSPDSDRLLAEVASLARQGNRLAAIQSYREGFDSSLQEARLVVERLALDGEADPGWVVAQVRADLVSSRVAQTEDPEKSRIASCLYAGLAVLVITSFLVPLLAGLAQAGGPLRKTWDRINPVGFARLVGSFGGEGTSPGLFSNPRAISLGPDGSIYVGDYTDGRIQRFNSRGEFVNQWFTREESYLESLAVDRTGNLFAAYQGEILRFEGASGEPLGPVLNPGNLNFEQAVLTPDGGLLAVASGEDLVRLDKAGRVQWILPEAISSISGDGELNARLAVDGLGNIYALGTFNSAVFKFSPEGRFLNRWGSAGDQPGQLRAPNAIAVDGYGRVAVSDIHGVQVFAGQDGRYLDRFDVPGVALALAFDQQNDLYAASNDHKVYHYRLKEPQPIVNRLIQPKQMVFGWEN